jgi:diaminohydroxyphosphoribosylaminopyrimidine deaminase/5-amino-6-(5-phosphoribosylamino)uracil reductase
VREVMGRSPHRFVIDINAGLPSTLKLYNDENYLNTFTFVSSKYLNDKKIAEKDINKIFIKEKNKKLPLRDILKEIYKLGISSLMVEGGGKLFSKFIEEKIFDDVYFMIAPKIIGKGIQYSEDIEINRLSDSNFLNLERVISSNGDIILYYKIIK